VHIEFYKDESISPSGYELGTGCFIQSNNLQSKKNRLNSSTRQEKSDLSNCMSCMVASTYFSLKIIDRYTLPDWSKKDLILIDSKPNIGCACAYKVVRGQSRYLNGKGLYRKSNHDTNR
jgi:hypothetical protein